MEFIRIRKKTVIGAFDGGKITSDAEVLLLFKIYQ